MQGEDQLDGGREARGGKRAKSKGHGKTDRAAGLREPESPEEDGKELLGKSPKLPSRLPPGQRTFSWALVLLFKGPSLLWLVTFPPRFC